MSTLLTLHPPTPNDRQPPFTGLLSQRCPDAAAVSHRRLGAIFGPPVVAASALGPGMDESVVVSLDVAPDTLASDGPVVARFDIDCSLDQLEDAIELTQPESNPHPLSAPLAVFVAPDDDAEAGWVAEVATRVADAGAHPGLRAGSAPDEVADFLAVLAHSDAGFVARATSGAEALAILTATVAALRGDDVRTAFVAPDPARVAGLNQDAAEALRTVLLSIEVDDAEEAERHLAAHGITATAAP
ncbi:hypothetical protein BTZ20_5763 [Rhodococcus sp. MTM3W5.2]|uniref:hypothetical protein n=1 Tax=Rhodococcus sp. MTM3W5.2 TaxID=1805827 RepID=UPI0009795C50|nr:hypothetical protein [Rhodococcus sp. MTM3W5.2]AQA25365.1 hypothetical protein BTZ20_5763 [Rhodococcus sp. MTM3W5.2]